MRPLSRLGIFAVLALFLTACVGGKTYDEDVTYKVDEIADNTWARLSIQGQAPGEPLSQIRHVSAKLDDVPSDVKVGDVLVCRVHQSRKNLADTNVELTVDNCRHS